MHKIYSAQLHEAGLGESDSQKLSYLSSVMRSLLQTLALSAFEIALRMTPAKDDGGIIKGLLDRFAQPVDGLPLEALDALIPIVRSNVAKTYMLGWFEKSIYSNQPIVNQLIEWVEFRNKKPAHGVVDEKTATFWANRLNDLIQSLLTAFSADLPKIEKDGTLALDISGNPLRISTPLVVSGHAVVIAKVVSRKGLWKIHGQLLSWTDAKEFTADLDNTNIFATDDPYAEKFKLAELTINGKPTSIFHNIPVRQTNTFVGRKKELDKLKKWIDDFADSRMCLVYGDGGFGKTTLSLEFFNNLIEGKLEDSTTLPSVVCFYTAKKTRWTDDGIIHFKGISDAMEDGVRELLYLFFPVLGKEWYKVSGNALIDKIQGEFVRQGFTRHDILLIIDNTETLATSQLDAEELGEFLTTVGKKLGRVVITSRRRELLNATPVVVSSLSDDEALLLIQRSGKEYKAQAVIQAGEARLRAACKQLMYKPLLIDTLVRYISRSSSGLQDGLDQILKKTNDQLLEFLYEDAWARMNELVREVFMVLVSLASPINGRCIGDACTAIGVQHTEFQESLNETYFASVIDHGDTYDLEIVDLAKEFFRQKKHRASDAVVERLDNIAFKVDKLETDRHKIEMQYRQDRVADGYRNEFAKAAKIAGMKRDYKSAIENFDLALLDEPLNASLHERYASFLLRTLNRPEAAHEHAIKATELDPQSGDAWLTLGLIDYKLDRLSDGDKAIDKAFDNGKDESLCLLRKSIARYHHARREPYRKDSLRLLKEGEAMINRSVRVADPKAFYFRKNAQTSDKYLNLIQSLISQINRRTIRSEDAAS
ncbi:tetratricopeptide (TPR) repeat protein [Paraburkholderia sp. CI2]|uniref:tetratricopeptide repeat protein n=1 Tax=Paraburkholderia sp. CI2 TaxID=2723093 RepID=UPI00160A6093|nr:ATP-binding protein [Paraburkholderia sp. CI2]MBB5471081.1 tetratricopeptide (TPR) repeat protein [Paraburkholderia sp. CI2]